MVLSCTMHIAHIQTGGEEEWKRDREGERSTHRIRINDSQQWINICHHFNFHRIFFPLFYLYSSFVSMTINAYHFAVNSQFMVVLALTLWMNTQFSQLRYLRVYLLNIWEWKPKAKKKIQYGPFNYIIIMSEDHHHKLLCIAANLITFKWSSSS